MLVLFGSQRLHQVAFITLRNGAERVFDVTDLENGKPDSLGCVPLRIKVAGSWLLSSRIVVDKNLYDVFIINLIDGHLRTVGAKRLCQMKTRRAAYSAQCARVPCLEAASEPFAQGFWYIVGCDEVVRVKESFELLVYSW